MNRLYVTDLDGTLLNDEGRLSEYSFNAIKGLLEEGVYFTVASARSVMSIQNILRGLDLKLPIVSFNGAYVSDFKTGHHHHIQKITNTQLFDLLKESGVLVSTHKANEDMLYYAGSLSKGSQQYVDDRKSFYNVVVEPIDILPADRDIMAYTLIDTYENLSKVKDRLDVYDDIIVDLWEDMYYKPWYWMSIHAKGATKANGIEILKQMIEVPFSDLVVFGDNTNDIEMFKCSDMAIAVDNAVDDLKVYASYTIASNTDNSVVKEIAKLEGIEI